MRYKILYLFLFIITLAACSQHDKNEASKRLIPRPEKFYFTDNGSFKLTPKTRLIFNSDFAQVAEHARFLASVIKKSTGFTLQPESF